MDNIAKFCVELEAVFNGGGLKEMYKDFTDAGKEVSAMFEDLRREAQSGGDIIAATAFSGFSSLQNNLEDFCNAASESFGRLDVLIKNVWENKLSCKNGGEQYYRFRIRRGRFAWRRFRRAFGQPQKRRADR